MSGLPSSLGSRNVRCRGGLVELRVRASISDWHRWLLSALGKQISRQQGSVLGHLSSRDVGRGLVCRWLRGRAAESD